MIFDLLAPNGCYAAARLLFCVCVCACVFTCVSVEASYSGLDYTRVKFRSFVRVFRNVEQLFRLRSSLDLYAKVYS